MSLFSKLKAVDVKRDTRPPSLDPVNRVRTKMVNALDEQLALLNAQLEGKTVKATRIKYVDGPSGQRVRQEVEKRARPWFFMHNGLWYTEIRYGSSPLTINGGTAIEAGKKQEDLENVYNILKQGTQDGLLDDQLLELAAERGKRRKSANANREPEPQPRSRRRA